MTAPVVHTRILALDVGDRHIGVAVSDPLGIAAHPVKTLERRRLAADIGAIRQLIETLGATELVVGLPRMMNGTVGVQAQKVQEFAEALRPELSVPITFWDERLSTVAAERFLAETGTSSRKRKAVVDQVAAVFILQSYLEHLAMRRGAVS